MIDPVHVILMALGFAPVEKNVFGLCKAPFFLPEAKENLFVI
jgi:hypothetical protein